MSKRFESLWDGIEETPAAAANMKLRSSLMSALTDFITAEKLTRARLRGGLG